MFPASLCVGVASECWAEQGWGGWGYPAVRTPNHLLGAPGANQQGSQGKWQTQRAPSARYFPLCLWPPCKKTKGAPLNSSVSFFHNGRLALTLFICLPCTLASPTRKWIPGRQGHYEHMACTRCIRNVRWMQSHITAAWLPNGTVILWQGNYQLCCTAKKTKAQRDK